MTFSDYLLYLFIFSGINFGGIIGIAFTGTMCGGSSAVGLATVRLENVLSNCMKFFQRIQDKI